MILSTQMQTSRHGTMHDIILSSSSRFYPLVIELRDALERIGLSVLTPDLEFVSRAVSPARKKKLTTDFLKKISGSAVVSGLRMPLVSQSYAFVVLRIRRLLRFARSSRRSTFLSGSQRLTNHVPPPANVARRELHEARPQSTCMSRVTGPAHTNARIAA